MYNNLPVMHQFVPYTQAKTLRGRKNTLAPVFFYWGGGGDRPLRSPRIDATAKYDVTATTTVLWPLSDTTRLRLSQYQKKHSPTDISPDQKSLKLLAKMSHVYESSLIIALPRLKVKVRGQDQPQPNPNPTPNLQPVIVTPNPKSNP